MQSKQIRKRAKNHKYQSPTFLKKRKSLQEAKKVIRCKVAIIPPETKIAHSSPIFYIFGDIAVMIKNQSIIFDIAFLNEFKIYRDIRAIQMYSQTLLIMKVEDRGNKDMTNWIKLVDELKISQVNSLIEMANTIQTFCQKYQRIFGRQCRKKPKSDLRRSYFVQVTDETEKTKKHLFETFPCFQLKFRHKTHQNQLNELILSERLIRMLGYTTEQFADLILKEGIPQILHLEEAPESPILKELLEKYFTFGPSGYETQEMESCIYLKHGYMRNVRYKIHYLMNYENNSFGIDMMIVILDQGDPYKDGIMLDGQEIGEGFLQAMTSKEKETEYFLSTYYNLSIFQQYSNLHKICGVKEMPTTFESNCKEEDGIGYPRDDESIIVKKYEEEELF